MNFATLAQLLIPEGPVSKIESGGRLLWAARAWPQFYQTTRINSSRPFAAATTVGNYALIGGGCAVDFSSYSTTVESFDKSLTRASRTSLNKARAFLAATTVGDYALFAGGRGLDAWSDSTVFNTVDAYNASLTHSAKALVTARESLAAVTIGNHALFAGGSHYNPDTETTTYYSTVDAFDASLTRTTASSLSAKRSDLGATAVGDYALFAGGYGETHTDISGRSHSYSTVDAYNKSLTRSTAPALSTNKADLAAAALSTYAVFGGGDKNGYALDTVDAYDASLTRTLPTGLAYTANYPSAVSVGDYAFFAGGHSTSYSATRSTVNAYNKYLTRRTLTPLSEARYGMAATALGPHALFCTGKDVNDGGSYAVDVYVVTE